MGSLARDAFSLAHFLIIGGIVGFAVAIEEIAAHPAEPAPAAVIAALGVGVALFVVSSALSLRLLGGPVLVPRIAILVVMAVLIVIVAPLPPVWPLVVVAGALMAIVLVEGAGHGLIGTAPHAGTPGQGAG